MARTAQGLVRIPGLIRQLKVQKFTWPLSCTGGPVSVIPCGRPDAQKGGRNGRSEPWESIRQGSKIAKLRVPYMQRILNPGVLSLLLECYAHYLSAYYDAPHQYYALY